MTSLIPMVTAMQPLRSITLPMVRKSMCYGAGPTREYSHTRASSMLENSSAEPAERQEQDRIFGFSGVRTVRRLSHEGS